MSTQTNNPWLLDTICLIVGAGAILVGLFFLWRALFGDKAGRKPGCRRCPKCWYDMAGVPALLCPECGEAAKDEAGLRRRRRHWRAACLWAFVVVLGFAGALTPRMSRQGIVGAVPTTLLVWWAPVKGGPGVQSRRSQVLQVAPSQTLVIGGQRLTYPDLPWDQQLEAEAWRRVTTGETWAWQSRALVERWLKHHQSSIEQLVVIPKRWTQGERVPVLIMPERVSWEITDLTLGGPRARASGRNYPGGGVLKEVITLTSEVVRAGEGDVPGKLRIREPLEIVLQGISVPLGELDVTIDGLTPSQALLEGLDDQATTELVRAVLSPRVVVDAWGKDVVVGNRSEAPIWQNVDFAIAVTLRVMLDGKCLGTCETTVNWDYPVWKDYTEAPMVWTEGGLEALLASPERATILVTGNQRPAERQYSEWPFGRRAAAWTGSFEVPVRVESTRTREK